MYVWSYVSGIEKGFASYGLCSMPTQQGPNRTWKPDSESKLGLNFSWNLVSTLIYKIMYDIIFAQPNPNSEFLSVQALAYFGQWP